MRSDFVMGDPPGVDWARPWASISIDTGAPDLKPWLNSRRTRVYSLGMLIACTVLLLLGTVALAGGRPGRLADVRPRRAGLVFAALAVQVVIVSIVPRGPAGLHAPVHVATYLLLA